MKRRIIALLMIVFSFGLLTTGCGLFGGYDRGTVADYEDYEDDEEEEEEEEDEDGKEVAVAEGSSEEAPEEISEADSTDLVCIGKILFDESDNMRDVVVYEYDPHFCLIGERWYYYSGKSMEYRYDESGNRTNVMMYDFDGSIMAQENLEYDEYGNLVSHIDAMRGAMIQSFENKYGETGKLIESLTKDKYGQYTNQKEVYEYDVVGNLKSVITYNVSTGEATQEIRYNADGSITDTINYAGGQVTFQDSYKYDKQGNAETRTVFQQGDGSVTFTYENEYDEAGNLLTSVEYMGGNMLTQTEEYIYMAKDEFENVSSPENLLALAGVPGYEMQEAEVEEAPAEAPADADQDGGILRITWDTTPPGRTYSVFLGISLYGELEDGSTIIIDNLADAYGGGLVTSEGEHIGLLSYNLGELELELWDVDGSYELQIWNMDDPIDQDYLTYNGHVHEDMDVEISFTLGGEETVISGPAIANCMSRAGTGIWTYKVYLRDGELMCP